MCYGDFGSQELCTHYGFCLAPEEETTLGCGAIAEWQRSQKGSRRSWKGLVSSEAWATQRFSRCLRWSLS